MTDVTGSNFIAGIASRAGDSTFSSIHARSGTPRSHVQFHEATTAEVTRAASEAEAALSQSGPIPSEARGMLLREIALRLDDAAPELLATAGEESGLAWDRLAGELNRTTQQLQLFSDLVSEGSFVDAVIDHSEADASDLRRMSLPIGPVAVFGASNFPLAFSIPGGDTASALAAGCPVIAKAHPAHPETSERAALAIIDAIESVGLHPGTFSMVHGCSTAVGRALVDAPPIRAVAFTGSSGGGRALFDRAAARHIPIPVYAEMGSINPVLVTRSAAQHGGAAVAEALAGSVALGCGQFCTKPGVVFVPEEESDAFVAVLRHALSNVSPAPMLTESIRERYLARLVDSRAHDGVDIALEPEAASSHGIAPTILRATLAAWMSSPSIREEHFGPAVIVVAYQQLPDVAPALAAITGSLTATIHAADDDDLDQVLPQILTIAGRVVFGGVPTGVAVTTAMHHGGPYPATTHPAFTSVGTDAVRRFLRPVTFQNAPADRLPAALQDSNPLGIMRRLNGSYTRAPVPTATG